VAPTAILWLHRPVSIDIPTETVCITDDDGRPVDLLSVTARKRSSNGARVSVEQT
jgi:hypothetical protein